MPPRYMQGSLERALRQQAEQADSSMGTYPSSSPSSSSASTSPSSSTTNAATAAHWIPGQGLAHYLHLQALVRNFYLSKSRDEETVLAYFSLFSGGRNNLLNRAWMFWATWCEEWGANPTVTDENTLATFYSIEFEPEDEAGSEEGSYFRLGSV